MTIMTRFIRLFKADVHGVMDQLEDKKLLLKQYLREMETSLDQKEAQLSTLSTRIDRLTAHSQRQTAEITKIDQDVDLALSEEKNDIARRLIRRRIDLTTAVGQIKDQISAASKEKASLAETINDQQLQYETLKARAETWHSHAENETFADAARSFPTDVGSIQIRDEQIELELIRRKAALAKDGAK
jgi:phage shock protein A